MSDISKPCPTCHNEMKDMGCGHSPYWRTIYDNCMACRVEKAESQLEAEKQKRLEAEGVMLKLANAVAGFPVTRRTNKDEAALEAFEAYKSKSD
jgi:hypothetical protein